MPVIRAVLGEGEGIEVAKSVGEVVEGFGLKPAGGSKQFSDHVAKLRLGKVALQQTRHRLHLDATETWTYQDC